MSYELRITNYELRITNYELNKKLYEKALPILLALLTFNNANAQGWKWCNPTPQGNTLKSCDFSDNNTGLAVGECGTILLTFDLFSVYSPTYFYKKPN